MQVLMTTDSISAPLTGIGRYTWSLAQALSALPDVCQLSYLSRVRVCHTLPQPSAHDSAPDASVAASPRLSPFDLRRVLSRSLLAQTAYIRSLRVAQTFSLRGLRPDLVHGTNYWLPPCDGAGVLTVHDLSMVRYPACHKQESLAVVTRRLEAGVRRAAVLLTPSECIRREVATHFAWPLSRVVAVAHGWSPSFRPQSAAALAPMLTRRGLDYRGYSLFVGTIEPRKNLLCLLDAYLALPESIRLRTPLVIAGDVGWNSDAIHERLQQATRQGWLHYLGYVSESDLPGLFAGAKVFTFPSLYEGFGLPVLEALACATPVVCSDAAALTEIVGHAALVSPVGDVERLRDHLEQALTDDVWWLQAQQAGLERAAMFSWERAARKTLAAYRLAMDTREAD